MKPTPKSKCEVLAFGAHPDDIEFGCGGVIAAATRLGAQAHFIVCSRGESGSQGTPEQRSAEARAAARILGATLEFVPLDGDGRLEHSPAHARALAARIRAWRPRIVLAPTPAENQHPDHSQLGRIVRDAARLARYGGVRELKAAPPHVIGTLLFYAVTAEGEPAGSVPILFDVSEPADLNAWKQAMAAHASQAAVQPYADLQLSRARVQGLRAGVSYAIALFPNDPLVFADFSALGASARRF